MSDAIVTTYIEKRIRSQINFQYPGYQMDDRNVEENTAKKRVAYLIIGGKATRSTLGAKWDRHIGILQIDVIVPARDGNGERDEVCDFLADAFNEWEDTLANDIRLRFKVPSQRDFGTVTGESKKIVSIPFWVDVLKR